MPLIPPAWQGDADKRNEPLTPLEVETAWERFYNGDQDLDVITVMRLFVTVDKLRDQANMASEAAAQAGRRESEARATLDAWRPVLLALVEREGSLLDAGYCALCGARERPSGTADHLANCPIAIARRLLGEEA